MKEGKLYLRIGEVSRLLGVRPHVIRYWEQEFGLRPKRGLGMQRRYTQEEVERLLTIKRLLYEEGYTIAGAKKKLRFFNRRHDPQAVLREVLEELKEIESLLKSPFDSADS